MNHRSRQSKVRFECFRIIGEQPKRLFSHHKTHKSILNQQNQCRTSVDQQAGLGGGKSDPEQVRPREKKSATRSGIVVCISVVFVASGASVVPLGFRFCKDFGLNLWLCQCGPVRASQNQAGRIGAGKSRNRLGRFRKKIRPLTLD